MYSIVFICTAPLGPVQRFKFVGSLNHSSRRIILDRADPDREDYLA